MPALNAKASGPLLHIGYHKTGTTWLQVELFMNEAYGFLLPWSQKDAVDRFVFVNPFTYDAENTRARMQEGLERAAEKGRVAAISHERLSGSPFSGGHDSLSIANRLCAVFPEGRVLIVIREQKAMLRSIYMQYVREGGTASLSNFMCLPARHRAHIPLYDRRFQEYHYLINHYFNLFGRDRVLVLPYEHLLTDPSEFLARLTDFAGVPQVGGLPDGIVNPSMRGLTLSLRRPLNLLFSRNSLNPGGPFFMRGMHVALRRLSDWSDRLIPDILHRRREDGLQAAIAADVGDYFATSNRVTMELTGLDLKALGYSC